MSVLKLFPTQLYRAPLYVGRAGTSALRTLREESLALQKLDVAGREWSKENYPYGYTSYSSLTDLPMRAPAFASLRDAVDKHARKFARALQLDLKGRELEMTTCWVNVMGRYAQHSFHLHPRSVLSGTVYVHVPKDAGVFKIEDPRVAAFMGSPERSAKARLENRRYVSLEPKAGEVLLFESWLKHEVAPSRSKEPRISVSFNYDLV